MIWRRMKLRRADGRVYLDRWGIGHKRLGAVMLHRMDAPDPGVDLHDHPWPFVSIILAGGYTEERAATRSAPMLAAIAEQWPKSCRRGVEEHRGRWSVRRMRLDECHRVVALDGRRSWSLVITGRAVRRWGFYLADGFMDEATYDSTVRAVRRDMAVDNG